jgi:hypothetical protein
MSSETAGQRRRSGALTCRLPFTRAIAVAAVVGETLASSLAEARVPATVILEARKALAGTIDFEREMGAGDRFYVRHRQPFTVDGTPIGTAQLIWLELRTTAKGTVANQVAE